MTEGIQNLSQQIQEQVLKSAQDFYGNSLGSLKSHLQNDSSQLKEMLEQLPHSQQDARAQLEALLASYEALQSSLDEFAQQHGVEDAVNQVAQQAQQSVGQEGEGASDQVQKTVGQAAQGVQDTTGDAAGQAQDVAGGGEMTEQAHEAAEETAGEVAGQEQQDTEEEVQEETGQSQGVVGRATQGVGKAVGKVGRTARRLVPGMHLLSEETDEEAGQTVQRTVDESGDIIETTLDESGEPVNEEIVGTVNDLPTEEEYTNEEGQTVRTVKEQRGALIHLKLGPDGSLLDLRLPPQKEEVKEEEVLEEGGRSESSTETS